MTEVTTALSIILQDPADVQRVDEIRSKHDRAYPRWMPHINLLFPFVPQDQFADIEARLQPVLEQLEPVEILLDQVSHFKQKKQATVHLKPSNPDHQQALQTLYQIVRTTLPEIPVKRDEFNAHLTLAQYKNSETEEQITALQNIFNANPIRLRVDRLYILQRSTEDKSVPFHIAKKIPFGP